MSFPVVYRHAPRTVHRVLRDQVLVGTGGSEVVALDGSVAVVFIHLDVRRTLEGLVSVVVSTRSLAMAPPAPDEVREKIFEALAILDQAGLIEQSPRSRSGQSPGG